jgi:hypothetical protein
MKNINNIRKKKLRLKEYDEKMRKNPYQSFEIGKDSINKYSRNK